MSINLYDISFYYLIKHPKLSIVQILSTTYMSHLVYFMKEILILILYFINKEIILLF